MSYQTTPGESQAWIVTAAGNKRIEASVFLLQHLQYLLKNDTQAGNYWGEHITFATGMNTLEKYIGLDNIIPEGQSFSVIIFTLSISSSLASFLESFHLLIFIKSHPYLRTCKETLWTNGTDGQKDPLPRWEVMVKPFCQYLSLPPAVSRAGPGCSSNICTCALPLQLCPFCTSIH